MFKSRAGVRERLRRLEEENQALHRQVAGLEASYREQNRIYRQWENLLGYDGHAQANNLQQGEVGPGEKP